MARTHELVALKVWQPATVYVLVEPLTGDIPVQNVIRELQPGVQHRKVEGYDVVLQRGCR